MRILLSTMIIFISFVHISLAQTTPAIGANVDPAKKALILKFIDIFGTRAAMQHNIDMIVEQAEAQDVNQAKQMRDRIKVDEIIERLVPVYDKHFTASQLTAYINFYTSADGKLLVENLPVLMKESVGVATQYLEENEPKEAK